MGTEFFVAFNGAVATVAAASVARSLWRDHGNPGRRLLKALLLVSLLVFVYAYAGRLLGFTFGESFIGLARIATPAAFVAVAGWAFLE